MNRILLVLDHAANRRLLAESLRTRYEVIAPGTADALAERFDLCVLDGMALDRLWEQVQARRAAALPEFVPFLLVIARQDVGLATRHLWRTVDDLIFSPIEKAELQARVESLLAIRRLSVELEKRVAERTAALSTAMRELERANELLRQSQARLRLTAEAAGVGLWDWDLETNKVYFSPEWKRQIGYRDDEIADDFVEFQSRIHPDDLEPTQAKMNACLAHPLGRHEVEFRLRHKDGSYRWIFRARRRVARCDRQAGTDARLSP